MAIVVEVDGVRVECEDAKAARKALRVAAKVAEAKAAAERENCELARLRAHSWAYRILFRKLTEGLAPRAWSFHSASEGRFQKFKRRSSYDDVVSETMTYDTADGPGTIDHYRAEVFGVIENGSGWVIATIIRNEGGSFSAYAVGVAGDQCVLTDLPGIDRAFFVAETLEEAVGI